MVLNDSPPVRLGARWLLAVGLLAALALPLGLRGADAEDCSAAGCDRATASTEADDAPASETRRKGSTERPAYYKFLLGTVADEIVKRAPCNVLVVRTKR